MKIEAVESILVGGAHFVQIRTDNGLVGLGQSGAWAYPEAVDQVVKAWTPYLLGTDPMRTEYHWYRLYRMGPFRGSVVSGAVSAVDIALWDLKGQFLQVPIWELLGGRTRNRIRLHLIIDGGTPDDIAERTRLAVKDGFTAIKFDPIPEGYQDMGLDRLVSTVREATAAAREQAGPDVDIILELARKLTPLQAAPIARGVREFHPLFLEDPIQIDSIVSQADVAKRITTAVANGERMHTIWEFRELLVRGGSQYVRPDVGLAGGLTHCKKIAAVAEAFHSDIVTHNFLGPVLTTASVHLDVSIPNFVVQEYSSFDEGPEVAGVFVGALKREGGYLPIPDTPGLGIRLATGIHPGTEAMLGPRRDASAPPLRADGSVASAI